MGGVQQQPQPQQQQPLQESNDTGNFSSYQPVILNRVSEISTATNNVEESKVPGAFATAEFEVKDSGSLAEI